jgi:hypothetical protein
MYHFVTALLRHRIVVSCVEECGRVQVQEATRGGVMYDKCPRCQRYIVDVGDGESSHILPDGPQDSPWVGIELCVECAEEIDPTPGEHDVYDPSRVEGSHFVVDTSPEAQTARRRIVGMCRDDD